MSRVLGAFPEDDALPSALSVVRMEAVALDLIMHWTRCSRTADFLAGFFADAFEDRKTAANVLSTVVNELVENAAKFSGDKHASVHFDVRHRGEMVDVRAESVAEPRHVERLVELFDVLARDGAEAVFADRIGREGRGGLGLVMLAKDYAELGARIGAPGDSGLHAVTIRAAVRTEDVEQI